MRKRTHFLALSLSHLLSSARRELRELLSEVLSSRNISLSENSVVTGNGTVVTDLTSLIGELGTLEIKLIPKGIQAIKIHSNSITYSPISH